MIGKLIFIFFVFLAGLVVGIFYDFGSIAREKVLLSPSNFLDNSDVTIYKDRVVIKVSGAMLSSYESSGSMLPFFGGAANGITIVPDNEEDVGVGDIITFESEGVDVVHRIIKMGVDSKGTYYITKGDSNSVNDEKIRFGDIKRVLIGIIY